MPNITSMLIMQRISDEAYITDCHAWCIEQAISFYSREIMFLSVLIAVLALINAFLIDRKADSRYTIPISYALAILAIGINILLIFFAYP